MTYLVVSDYLADYLKGRPHATTLLERLFPEGLTISIVSFAELYEGIYYGHTRTRYEQGWRLFLGTTQ